MKILSKYYLEFTTKHNSLCRSWMGWDENILPSSFYPWGTPTKQICPGIPSPRALSGSWRLLGSGLLARRQRWASLPFLLGGTILSPQSFPHRLPFGPQGSTFRQNSRPGNGPDFAIYTVNSHSSVKEADEVVSQSLERHVDLGLLSRM